MVTHGTNCIVTILPTHTINDSITILILLFLLFLLFILIIYYSYLLFLFVTSTTLYIMLLIICCSDMAIQNVIGDAFRGATWVSIHNGGGVGW